jgi:hypothetical protein
MLSLILPCHDCSAPDAIAAAASTETRIPRIFFMGSPFKKTDAAEIMQELRQRAA